MPDQCPKCHTQIPKGSRFCQGCGNTVELAVSKPKASKANRKKPAGGSLIWFGIGGLLAVALIALLIFRPGGAGSVAQMSHDEMMGHLRSQAGPVPTWLARADREVVTEYTWAVDHHEELQYIPCYCGCYQSSGHTSNYNCYFARSANGRVAGYDPHSYG